ncbi:MAG: DUF5317 domain-containing protein [Anaerolineaceae bacterium]|nr:DUF5317 domain-containing protein [Anaerolineaceae bacterium]
MFIFLPPILLGVSIALIKARFNIRTLKIPIWKSGFIFPIALLVMLPVINPRLFHIDRLNDTWAAILLGVSQLFLLIFVLRNIKQAGIWILGLGFLFNMICMQANGGLMPVQPHHVAYLLDDSELSDPSILIGTRFGNSKDVVLSQEETNLWILGDRFTLPVSFPYRVVFSLGDIVIGIGLFYILYQMVPGKFIELGARYEYTPYQLKG